MRDETIYLPGVAQAIGISGWNMNIFYLTWTRTDEKTKAQRQLQEEGRKLRWFGETSARRPPHLVLTNSALALHIRILRRH